MFGLLVAAVPLLAHHHAVQAEFDYDKEMTLTGTLERVEWVNPHAFFFLAVAGENGDVTTWSVATVGPSGLRRVGLSRPGFFEVGKTYTLGTYQALDGTDFAWLRDVTLPDGRVVTVWSGKDGR